MRKEFQYSTLRRWLPLSTIPFLIIASYGATLEVIQSQNIAHCIGCLLFSGLSLFLSFKIPNHCLVKIFTSKDGIVIRKLFYSKFIMWDEIIEYGRYRTTIFGGKAWCFYVKSILYKSRKVHLGFEFLKDISELNNIIIRNANGAKFKNTKIIQMDTNG